jgi:hypothetical protein
MTWVITKVRDQSQGLSLALDGQRWVGESAG